MGYKLFSLIILIITILVVTNSLLINWIDRKTKFKRELMYEKSSFVLILILFGVLFVPFLKQLRYYRKDIYFKNKIKQLSFQKLSWGNYYHYVKDIHKKDWEDCNNYFRYKKIQKLQSKSKPFYKKILL